MKWEKFLWLVASTAGAAPMMEWGEVAGFSYPGVRFGMRDHKLKITVFEDLHFGEPEHVRNRPDADNKTIKVMTTILDQDPVDLVVLNGDLTSCEWVAPENAESLMDQIMKPMLDRNIPFATAFGNHDMSKTCSTRIMSQRQWNKGKKNGRQLAFTTSSVLGDLNVVGTSNYYVPVYSSSGNGAPTVAMILWFFDSRGGRAYQQTDSKGQDVPVLDWVDEKVVTWFKVQNAAFRQEFGKVIPSIAFVHIPVHATAAFQHDEDGWSEKTEPGINAESIGHQGNGADGKYQGGDEPFMQALTETEGLMAVFSGHDHGVDWCMKWSANKPLKGNQPSTGNGINLCLGRHTGYGGYSDWMRGARQIVIDETKLGSKELETWIRLEDGSISGRVTLNSTYGTDEYPVVERILSPKKSNPKPSPRPKNMPKAVIDGLQKGKSEGHELTEAED